MTEKLSRKVEIDPRTTPKAAGGRLLISSLRMLDRPRLMFA